MKKEEIERKLVIWRRMFDNKQDMAVAADLIVSVINELKEKLKNI